MLTEAEIAALDDDAPVTSSNAPPMTTAPPGASVQQVEAGMREAGSMEREGRGRAGQYAAGGSLAEDTREEGEKKAGEPRAAQQAI